MSRAFIVTLILIVAPMAVAQSTFTIEIFNSGPSLREIDVTTGATISTVPLSGVTGGNGMTGLALHPGTGVFFAIDADALGSRPLVTIDPNTGVVTTVGSTGLPIGDLAFGANGTLYAIEGTLLGGGGRIHSLDTTTGAPTLLATLASGSGNSLVVSPTSGLLYRCQGDMLTSIDPNAGFAETLVGFNATIYVNGLGFDAGGDLLAISGSVIATISTTTGLLTSGPTGLDHFAGDLFQADLSLFPGTEEDLVTEVSVNGSPFATVPATAGEVISLLVGDTLGIRHLSPGGTFDFIEFVTFGSIAPIGTASTSPFPGLHFLVGGGLYAPVSGGVAGVPLILIPGGISYGGIHVGGALSGVSTLIQGASITSTAANGIFASTHGLLIEFL